MDDPHQGCDAKTRAGEIVGQGSEELDMPSIETDFFLGLAQGGVNRRAVHCLQSATGKADLARMVVQVVRPPGKQNGLRRTMIDQGHKHCRGHV